MMLAGGFITLAGIALTTALFLAGFETAAAFFVPMFFVGAAQWCQPAQRQCRYR